MWVIQKGGGVIQSQSPFFTSRLLTAIRIIEFKRNFISKISEVSYV